MGAPVRSQRPGDWPFLGPGGRCVRPLGQQRSFLVDRAWQEGPGEAGREQSPDSAYRHPFSASRNLPDKLHPTGRRINSDGSSAGQLDELCVSGKPDCSLHCREDVFARPHRREQLGVFHHHTFRAGKQKLQQRTGPSKIRRLVIAGTTAERSVERSAETISAGRKAFSRLFLSIS